MGRGEYLGELEAIVLSAVRSCSPANGVRVHTEIEAVTGRDPSVVAINVTLRRLEAKGFLASEQGDVSPQGGRPRRYYELTSAGEASLDAFHEMWRRLRGRARHRTAVKARP